MAKVILQQTPSNGEKSLFFMNGKGSLWFVLWSGGVILLYFTLSIGLTFYQRWFLQKFHYPLFVVMCHLLVKFIMASLCRTIWQCWQRRQRVRLSWINTIRKIAPMGFVSGLDIAFSNWGLEFVTVSLYTMTKSTSIIFILIFALLFKLEQKSWSLVMIVTMISGGLTMFTYKATQFDLLGFFFVLFASFSSGLRWTLAQFVMQRTELGLDHPIDMLYHVQPWMFISILPFAIAFEASQGVSSWHSLELASDFALSIALCIIGGALIAFAMEFTEYLVISQMSSLTLSVAGVFKEVCTLGLAFEWNGDELTKMKIVGLLMCLGGIVCHVIHKTRVHSRPSNQPQHKPLLDEASAHFLADASTSDDEDDARDDSSTEVLFSVLHSRDR